MNDLVSVIIPVFNREEFIYTSVNSVLNQTYNNWELLIIDDNSFDDSYFSVLPFLKDKRISYFYLTKNGGVSFARNFGLKKAKGRYICFLDSDDYWLPKKLEKQLEFMKNNSFKISQTEEIWLRKGKRVNPKNKHRKIEGYIFEKSLEMCMISPSAVMIEKTIFDDVGYFDENLRACEDYDLWLRLSLKFEVGLLKEFLIVKRGGHDDQLSSMDSLDKFRIYALIKLLKNENLNDTQREKVINVLLKKIEIYTKGCKKRNKIEEFQKFQKIKEYILSCKVDEIKINSIL